MTLYGFLLLIKATKASITEANIKLAFLSSMPFGKMNECNYEAFLNALVKIAEIFYNTNRISLQGSICKLFYEEFLESVFYERFGTMAYEILYQMSTHKIATPEDKKNESTSMDMSILSPFSFSTVRKSIDGTVKLKSVEESLLVRTDRGLQPSTSLLSYTPRMRDPIYFVEKTLSSPKSSRLSTTTNTTSPSTLSNISSSEYTMNTALARMSVFSNCKKEPPKGYLSHIPKYR